MIAVPIAACAPNVGPVTMAAIISYESGWHAYAIHDNTSNRSYYPASRAAALPIARSLLAAGDDIDVGLVQVNASNFAASGLDAATALEPCRNVRAGGRILTEAYRRASRLYGPGQVALAHALSAYNTGGLGAGAGYARAVFRAGLRLRGVATGRAVTLVRGRDDGRALAVYRATAAPLGSSAP